VKPRLSVQFSCPAVAPLGARTINAADFGVIPEQKDSTRPLMRALEACRLAGAKELLFSRGRYHFHPDFADEEYLFVSNNDEGLKRVVFALRKLEALTIDGQGSEFIFHGFLNPFIVRECRDITFRNFSVDCSRPFHSEGVIVAVHDHGMDVRIGEQFPYKVRNGQLVFVANTEGDSPLTTVSNSGIYGSGHLLEYDTQRRETAAMAKDMFFNGTKAYPAEELGGRIVRLRIPGLVGTPGNTLSFGPNHRNHPTFVVTRSADVNFENITIHHAGGMGIIGQFSHNLRVRACKVTPSPGRMISTTADATHFVNCTGAIELTDNLFENHKDDATNIHGIYVQVAEILSGREVVVQLKHAQQNGLDIFHPGSAVELVHGQSLMEFGVATIEAVSKLNKEFTILSFAGPLPCELKVGDAIAAVIEHAEVRIVGNTIRNNRARGMLLNCRGRTLVEGNYFHTPGAAILFEGDAFEWFEQGGVRDCLIRNNIFDNCLFGVWGQAVIDVMAGIREQKEVSRYNRNIRIENNTFRMFDALPLLHAYCVDGLRWSCNKVEQTDAYAPANKGLPPFIISHCDNVKIDTE
jgi:hypothetical protein